MKKIISASILLTTLVSCGSPDGTAEDTDGLAPENHRIFVTSSAYTGSLGGHTGADTKCTNAARSAGLARNYSAILSTASVKANDSSRINITGGVYIFSSSSEKVLVAGSNEDFWATDTKAFLNKINIDELYASASGVKVWTGTGSDGAIMTGDHCNSWDDGTASYNGFYGNPDILVDGWTETSFESCNNSNRIYCISQ